MKQWIGGRSSIPALCVAAIVGAALYSLLAPVPVTPELDGAAGKRAVIVGAVVRDPDVREKTTRLTIRPEQINGVMIYHNTSKVIISADRFTDIAYGDRVRANGILEVPESFETDSGRTFDYPMYLRAHHITHEMAFADVAAVSRGEGNPIVALLLSAKHALLQGIERAFVEPESALLAGLILGEKQSLGERLTEAFRRAGVVHIIVLSGYNVTLVVNSIAFFADKLLPRSGAIGVSALGILAFAVATGASETTVRASVMALLVLLARLLYRPQLALRLLALTAAGMALWNPYLVLFDLSYQLSVLATLGLILFSDAIASRLPWVTEKLGMREIVSTTLATQVTVLPLLVLSVGQVSAVFLPANALILPAVPFAMFFGFIAAILAIFSYAIAFPFTAVAHGLLWFITAVASFFGSFPFAAFEIPQDWTWPILSVLAVLYALAFLLVTKKISFPRWSRSGS